jgi:hypothetical protein
VNETNGRLLSAGVSPEAFAATLEELTANPARLRQLSAGARQTASRFSVEACADRVLQLYDRLVREVARDQPVGEGPWDRLLARLEIEWNLLVEKTSALAAAAVETEATKSRME